MNSRWVVIAAECADAYDPMRKSMGHAGRGFVFLGFPAMTPGIPIFFTALLPRSSPTYERTGIPLPLSNPRSVSMAHEWPRGNLSSAQQKGDVVAGEGCH